MRRLALAVGALLAAGCATVEHSPSGHLGSGEQALRDCAAFYRDLDERIDAAGVRDAQDARLPGFPYLRASRLLSSYRDEAAQDAGVLRALVARMAALDLAARRRELANLPGGGPAGALERAVACGATLRAADLADARAAASIQASAVVPDDYSSASRVLGLYLLTRYPFGAGVRRHLDEVRAAYARDLPVPPGIVLERHAPPAVALPRAAAASILARAAENPLRLPELRADDLEALFAAHAPAYEVEVSGAADRFGALRWEAGAGVPSVASAEPVVYRQAAWTRYRGRALLQLVYTVWFPERPADSPSDLLAGKLDGLTWRVTLAPDGEPVLYDTMHPCGCYHMFFPTPRAKPVPPAEDGTPEALEWMFSPQALPPVAWDERIVLRVAARTHYLERVTPARALPGARRYAFRDYDELRSLPRPEGGSASVFGPDGLIAGTERAERLLFWPMGIPSAGAMRQWGRHATAFAGRRHFDDADLLEKRFTLDLR
ncbi:MAG: hypothetical protein ACT4P9_09560 [Betaproteobacteria bacterium]